MVLSVFDASWFVHFGSHSERTKNYSFSGYSLGGVKFLVSCLLIELLSMHDVVVCFDSVTNKFDLMPEYKSGRPREAYISNQSQWAYSMLMKCGITCLKVRGREADDLIASVVDKYRGEYGSILCFTNDRDVAHNVFGNVKVTAACSGGMDIDAHNFVSSVQKNDVVEFNTISAYKVLVKDPSDKIRQFRSEHGLTGRELYNRYVVWGNRELPDDAKRPFYFGHEKTFRFFLERQEDLTDWDREELEKRISVVFPTVCHEDVLPPSNQGSVVREQLAKLLTVLGDDVALHRLRMDKVRLSEEEFAEFKENSRVLRDGTFAVENGFPVHPSFVSYDLDANMRLF
jgi:hypothetical protein